MKTELLATTAEEESSSPNNSNQFMSREKMEKLLELCLSRQKLLLIERNIGADFDQLKQTLVGCFVRVPVRGRPMLAIIRSVRGSCQIEWARFGRRLRLSELGYFEFDQVDPKMPGQGEMERWCQRREQKGCDQLSDEFIDEKLALLNKFTNETDEPIKAEPQSADENASICSGMEKENTENDDVSADENEEIEENDEFGEDEEAISVKAEELPELPNVEGLIRNRELLAQVLLPCKKFLKFFPVRTSPKAVSLATAGCLMAFRIAGKEQVVVDEITGVEGGRRTRVVHFKLGKAVVKVSQLVAVHEREITAQVFDKWLRRLTIKNEPVPNVQAKHNQKAHALARLLAKSNNVGQKKKQHMTRALAWKSEQQRNLPDIGPVVVTAEQVQLLADELGPDKLNRVLTGCFVAVTLWKCVLELKKQPNMRRHFVVPIERVVVDEYVDSSNSTLLLLNKKIAFRDQKTGKRRKVIRLSNISAEKFSGSDKLVVQSLLMLKELEIPLPNDQEIARKSAQLEAALVRASSDHGTVKSKR